MPSIPFRKKKKRNIGAIPGTLQYQGEEAYQPVAVQIFHYDKFNYEELQHVENLDICADYLYKPDVTWVNFHGVHEVDKIEKLGHIYNFHNLLLEDLLNNEERPKLENFEDYIFFTLKVLRYNDEANSIESEHISFILGSNYVISLQERKGDIFDPIRQRIRSGKGICRKRKADYLIYLLMDIVVDNYFVILDYIDDKIERLEDEIINDPQKDTLQKIQDIKKELIMFRKAINPLQEAVGKLEKHTSKLIEKQTLKYFKDVHDHLLQIKDGIESNRDLIAGLMDIYLSRQSNQMNEVMKVLTIIATIFIPLTFVAGVYGMNFQYMPELDKKWAYPVVLGLMFMIFSGMIIYFRKKKWL